jgi:dolichol kinase
MVYSSAVIGDTGNFDMNEPAAVLGIFGLVVGDGLGAAIQFAPKRT